MVRQSILDAVKKVCEAPEKPEFNETVELAINLKDIDLSVQSNRIDTEIILPKGRGKPVKVGIFASKEMVEKVSGVADVIITQEKLSELITNKKMMKKLASEVSFFLADVNMMPTIGRSLGGILGPRGKMPKPIPPTVDPVPIIKNLKQSVRARTRDKMTFHIPVGTRSMPVEDIAENVEEVINRLAGRLPRSEGNIKSIYIKTTMGRSVPISLS